MSQSITISQTEYEKLLNRIARLEQAIHKLLKKKGPAYGSEEWWDNEIKEGLEEVKQGKGVLLSTPEELQSYLYTLKVSDEN